eukprot:CAMPEP_0113821042 /NCGR_PEP_ID=MMETSP0328-20130328/1540_1 /TAXON_ID=39455 /ORGANISM="Alexandrium minutum" /LENGTH=224 /DNA_ID=CAMNT_0000788973 /DNA_START=66 /DNA_END=737 /DNA_ORIENTATION=+ /assembly_acc=CAM_ASM_000350
MATSQDGSPSNPWLQRVLLLIPFVGVLAVLIYNVFSWYRYFAAQAFFDNMEEGMCVLNSLEYRVPLLLKEYYYYPLLGTFGMPNSSWTQVPCDVNLTIFNTHGSKLALSPGRTLVYFTYWQRWVIDVIHDTCSKLVPAQAQAGRFACSFEVDAQGLVSQGVYIGSPDTIPRYPALYLMKAAGLSTCTLGPILLILFCCARGAMNRRRSTAAREVDSSDLRGTGK